MEYKTTNNWDNGDVILIVVGCVLLVVIVSSRQASPLIKNGTKNIKRTRGRTDYLGRCNKTFQRTPYPKPLNDEFEEWRRWCKHYCNAVPGRYRNSSVGHHSPYLLPYTYWLIIYLYWRSFVCGWYTQSETRRWGSERCVVCTVSIIYSHLIIDESCWLEVRKSCVFVLQFSIDLYLTIELTHFPFSFFVPFLTENTIVPTKERQPLINENESSTTLGSSCLNYYYYVPF